MAGDQITSPYRSVLPLVVATACLPGAAHAGQDAVRYPQSAPPRVVYIQKVDPGYEVRVLDVATGETHDLLHLINHPGTLSVARHGETLLVFGDSALHVVDSHGQGQETISLLPEPTTPKGNSAPALTIAGYLEDGSLAIVMDAIDAASTDTAYLYQRTADGWKRPETARCGYYEVCNQGFGFKHRLDTRTSDVDGPDPILGKAIERNPYFVSRSPRTVRRPDDPTPEGSGGIPGHAITFDFGASRSALVYTSTPYPDSPGDYIDYLALELPGQKPQVLCAGQCGGEVMGHYLLTDRLIDLSNGKVLLDQGDDVLKMVESMMWVY